MEEDLAGRRALCVIILITLIQQTLSQSARCQGAVNTAVFDDGATPLSLEAVKENALEPGDFSVQPVTVTCGDVGTQSTFTLTVDSGPNSGDTCTGQLLITDAVPPNVICKEEQVLHLDQSTLVTDITTQQIDGGSSDNCANNLQLTISETQFTCNEVGWNTVTLTGQDSSEITTAGCVVAVVASCDETFNATISFQSSSTRADGHPPRDAFDDQFDTFFQSRDSADPALWFVFSADADTTICGATITLADLHIGDSITYKIYYYASRDGQTEEDIKNNMEQDSGYTLFGGVRRIDVTANSKTIDIPTLWGRAIKIERNSLNKVLAIAEVSNIKLGKLDSVPPTASCSGDFIFPLSNNIVDAGIAILHPSDVDDSSSPSSDACPRMQLHINEGEVDNTLHNGITYSCNDVTGPHVITLTATDSSGNQNTCETTVNVRDVDSPNLQCHTAVVQLNSQGIATLADWERSIIGNSWDNCGIDTVTFSPPSLDCREVAKQGSEVTVEVVDVNGNQAECKVNVIAEDIRVSPTFHWLFAEEEDEVTCPTGAPSGTTCTRSYELLQEAAGIVVGQPTVVDLFYTVLNAGQYISLSNAIPNNFNFAGTSISIRFQLGEAPFKERMRIFNIGNAVDDAEIFMELRVTEANGPTTGLEATIRVGITDINGNRRRLTSSAKLVDKTWYMLGLHIPVGTNPMILWVNGEKKIETVADTDFDIATGPRSMFWVGKSFLEDPIEPKAAFIRDLRIYNSHLTDHQWITLAAENTVPQVNCDNTFTIPSGNVLDPYSVITSESYCYRTGGDRADSLPAKVSPSTFGCIDVGVPREVTITATDLNLQARTCTSTINIIDVEPPNPVCTTAIVTLDGVTGTQTLTANGLDGGSSDACDGARNLFPQPNTFIASRTSFGCLDVSPTGTPFVVVDLVVVDTSGNSATCSANVEVVDVTRPIVRCATSAEFTLSDTDPGSVIVDPLVLDAGTTDACGVDTIVTAPSALTCIDKGSKNVVVTFTDNSGREAQCTVPVTVVDTSPPNMHCATPTIILQPNTAAITTSQLDDSSFDNCGNLQLSASKNAFGCADIGTEAVILKGVDAEGLSSTCAAQVTILDDTDPIPKCKATTLDLLVDESGVHTLEAADVDNESQDNCALRSKVLSTSVFTCEDIPAAVATLVVTDTSDRSATCTVAVTVADTIDPIATCESVVSVSIPDSGTLQLQLEDVDKGASTDNCGRDNLAVKFDRSTFTCGDVSETVNVVFTITDEASLSDTCNSQVTIIDTTAPSINCVDVATSLTGSSTTLSVTQFYNTLTIRDNCDQTPIQTLEGGTTFTCSNLGESSVTVSTEDDRGNRAGCASTLTLTDATKPVAMCVTTTLTVALDAQGNGFLDASRADGGTTDNCLDQMKAHTITPNEFSCSDVGALTATFTATDFSDNTATCTVAVEVVDGSPPLITCSTGILELSIGDVRIPEDLCPNGLPCQIIEPVDLIQLNSLADNCGTPGLDKVSVSKDEFFCTEHEQVQDVTVTVADDAGLTTTCSAQVRIRDTKPPSANCKDISVALFEVVFGNIGPLGAVPYRDVSFVDLDAGHVDNCGGQLDVELSRTILSCADVGATDVTVTVTDASNAFTSTCISEVHLRDAVRPTAGCLRNSQNQHVRSVFLVDNSFSIVTADTINEGSDDDCGEPILSLSRSTYNCADVNPTTPLTVTLTARDGSDNTDTCSAIVEVQDLSSPNAACNGNLAPLTVQPGFPGTTLGVTTGDIDAGSFDNCLKEGAAGLYLDVSTFSCGDLANRERIVTLTAEDVAGTTDDCPAPVRLVDPSPPLALCKNGVVTMRPNDREQRRIFTNVVNAGSKDSDTVCPLRGITLRPETARCSDVPRQEGITIVQTVTDIYGNSASCTSTVVVVDNTTPTAACVPVITVELGGAVGLTPPGRTVVDTDDINDNSQDNCIKTMELDNSVFGCDDVGQFNAILLTVSDYAGHSHTCETPTRAVVRDTTPPTVRVQPAVSLDFANSDSIRVDEVDRGTTDACGISTRLILPEKFKCEWVGQTRTATFYAIDRKANQNSATFQVTITDSQPPVSACKPFVEVKLNHNGVFPLLSDAIDAGSTDECQPLFTRVSTGNAQPSGSILFDCDDIGDNIVVLTVQDGAGNTDTCTSTVTVVDDRKPEITCLPDWEQGLNELGQTNLAAEALIATKRDNCHSRTAVFLSAGGAAQENITFGCEETGPQIMQVAVRDNVGNQQTCEVNVNIREVERPVAICEDKELSLDDNGQIDFFADTITQRQARAFDISEASNDNCGNIVSWIADPPLLTCANKDTQQEVRVTVTDKSGNFAACRAVVDVVDSTMPTARCKGTPHTVFLDSKGERVVTVDDIDVGSGDNCALKSDVDGGRALIGTPLNNKYTCARKGSEIISLGLTDTSNNHASCDATVVVVDTQPPLITCIFIGTIQVSSELGINGRRPLNPSELDVKPTKPSNIPTSDNCGDFDFTVQPTQYTCDDTFDIRLQQNTLPIFDARTLTILQAVDRSNNRATCINRITVRDATKPVARCRATFPLELDPERSDTAARLSVGDINAGSDDNCGIVITRLNREDFTCADVGNDDLVVALSLTDAAGNEASCSSQIEVVDSVPPTAVCIDNNALTVELTSSGPNVINAEQINAGSFDNCKGEGSVMLSLDRSAYTCADLPEVDVTMTVLDRYGNADSCSRTVKIEDKTSPELSPRCFATVNIDLMPTTAENAGKAIAPLDIIAVEDGTRCDPNTEATFWLVNSNEQVEHLDCSFAENFEPMRMFVRDSSREQECDFQVFVQEQVPPVALCKEPFTVEVGTGDRELLANEMDAGSYDNCGIGRRNVIPSIFNCADVGEKFVSLVVTDIHRSDSTCGEVLTIVDALKPQTECEGTISRELPSGEQSPVVPLSLNEVSRGTTDNCKFLQKVDAAKFTEVFVPSVLTCGNVGTSFVTLTATDVSGNTDTCITEVKLTDPDPPLASCRSGTVKQPLNAQGKAFVQPEAIDNGSSDNCRITDWNLFPNEFSCGDVNKNARVTLTVADQGGHAESCTSVLRIVDEELPSANCRPAVVNLDSSGEGTLARQQIDNQSSDNCPSTLDLSISQTIFFCGDIGINSVTLTAVDGSANIHECVSDVAVTGPCVKTVGAGYLAVASDSEIRQGALINVFDGDDDTAVTVATTAGNPTKPPSVEIVFDTDPVTICNLKLVIDVNTHPKADSPTLTLDLYYYAGEHDDPYASVAPGEDPFVGFNRHILLLTGNPADYIITVPKFYGRGIRISAPQSSVLGIAELRDMAVEQIPFAICSQESVNLDKNGEFLVDPALLDASGITGCGFQMRVQPRSLTCANVAQPEEVSLIVVDSKSGKEASCSTTIRVHDITAPEAVCRPNLVFTLNTEGIRQLHATDLDQGSNDECGEVSLSLDKSEYTCDDIGTNEITLTATQRDGLLSKNAECNIFIQDATPPVARCRERVEVFIAESGEQTITIGDVDTGSTDACVDYTTPAGRQNLALSRTIFTCANVIPVSQAVGIQILLTASDSINRGTCETEVFVRDILPPTVSCRSPGPVTLNPVSGTAQLSPRDVDNGCFDQCGEFTAKLSRTEFDCNDVGEEVIVTLTVADNAGLQASCTQAIVVQEPEENIPVPQCRNKIVNLDEEVIITLGDVYDRAATNARALCPLKSISYNPTSFGCSDEENNGLVVVTITTRSDQIATCTSEIRVEDNTDPIPNCISTYTAQLGNSREVEVTGKDLDNGSTDDCKPPLLEAFPDKVSCSNVGTPVQGTLRASAAFIQLDGSRRSRSCASTIIVQDNNPPNAICSNENIFLNVDGEVVLDVSNTFGPNSSDNCDFDLDLIGAITDNNFGCGDIGPHTLTLRATDSPAGNVDTCTGIISVVDNMNPDAECKATVELPLGPTGTATLSFDDMDDNSEDNCNINEATSRPATELFTCGDVDIAGEVVELSVRDETGNVGTCTSRVFVDDRDAPDAICKTVVVNLGADGNGAIDPRSLNGGTTDNCVDHLTFAAAPSTFNCNDLGSTPVVTLEATDPGLNRDICTTTVSIRDDLAPEIQCKAQQLTVTLTGTIPTATVDIDSIADAVDNCRGAVAFSADQQLGCAAVGANTLVAFTARDQRNNVGAAECSVTIVEEGAPIAKCVNDFTLDTLTPTSQVRPAKINAASTDNCGAEDLEFFLSVSGQAGGLQNVVTLAAGTSNVLILTVRDKSGNTDTCETRVTVVPDSGSMCGGTNAMEVAVTSITTLNAKAGTKRIVDGLENNGWTGTASLGDEDNAEGLVDLRWGISDEPVLICGSTIVGVEADDVLFVEVTNGNFKREFGWHTMLELDIATQGPQTIIVPTFYGTGVRLLSKFRLSVMEITSTSVSTFGCLPADVETPDNLATRLFPSAGAANAVDGNPATLWSHNSKRTTVVLGEDDTLHCGATWDLRNVEAGDEYEMAYISEATKSKPDADVSKGLNADRMKVGSVKFDEAGDFVVHTEAGWGQAFVVQNSKGGLDVAEISNFLVAKPACFPIPSDVLAANAETVKGVHEPARMLVSNKRWDSGKENDGLWAFQDGTSFWVSWFGFEEQAIGLCGVKIVWHKLMRDSRTTWTIKVSTLTTANTAENDAFLASGVGAIDRALSQDTIVVDTDSLEWVIDTTQISEKLGSPKNKISFLTNPGPISGIKFDMTPDRSRHKGLRVAQIIPLYDPLRAVSSHKSVTRKLLTTENSATENEVEDEEEQVNKSHSVYLYGGVAAFLITLTLVGVFFLSRR